MGDSIVIPTNQSTHIDPYSSYLFDMGVQDSRVYLSRQVNYLLKSFGDDCVLSGMDVFYTWSGSLAKFDVYPGKCIVDTTLHIFRSTSSLELDLAPYDDSGYVVVSVSYKYIQTMHSNRPYFKVSYVSSDGQIQLPHSWSVPRDRLVLAIFKFKKDSDNNITKLIPYYTIIKISTEYYIPRAGVVNGITSFNIVWEEPIKLDGGTFFDHESQYAIIDFGGF